MIIRDGKPALVALDTLAEGAVFLFANSVFMLTDETDNKYLRIIDLENGVLGNIGPKQEVLPLRAAELLKHENG